MSTLPIYFTLGVAQYQIDWTFLQDAASGYLQINVNGSQVVYATTTSNNNFLINPGDYISATVYATATNPLTAESSLLVEDNVAGVLYNSATTGTPDSTISYGSYYPSGSGNIDGSSYQY